MSGFHYDLLMDSLKEHNDILCRLFRLRTSSNSDIDAFFKENNNHISKYIDRYIKSYLILMTKYIQKHRCYNLEKGESLDEHIFQKYFGLGLTESNQLKISHLLMMM